jgi:hypothetical protein
MTTYHVRKRKNARFTFKPSNVFFLPGILRPTATSLGHKFYRKHAFEGK